jgi:hypothetical protein
VRCTFMRYTHEMHAHETHAYEIHAVKCTPVRCTPERFWETSRSPTLQTVVRWSICELQNTKFCASCGVASANVRKLSAVAKVLGRRVF